MPLSKLAKGRQSLTQSVTQYIEILAVGPCFGAIQRSVGVRIRSVEARVGRKMLELEF